MKVLVVKWNLRKNIESEIKKIQAKKKINQMKWKPITGECLICK